MSLRLPHLERWLVCPIRYFTLRFNSRRFLLSSDPPFLSFPVRYILSYWSDLPCSLLSSKFLLGPTTSLVSRKIKSYQFLFVVGCLASDAMCFPCHRREARAFLLSRGLEAYHQSCCEQSHLPIPPTLSFASLLTRERSPFPARMFILLTTSRPPCPLGRLCARHLI